MKPVTIIKLIFGVVALCFWGGWCYLYEKFVSSGSEAANAAHPVLVNDHGTFVFITLTQDHVLKWMTAAAIASFVCGVAIDLYERKSGKSR